MRRDRRVAAAVDQRLERAHEAVPNRLVVAELDRLRLDVDPLAEPDARSGERRRVVDRALQRRLEDRPDAPVTLCAELADEPQGVVRRRRVLHVDPHEAVRRLGRGDHGLDVALAEVVVELQPEPGRLDADVGVEPVLLEGVERRDVLGRDRCRLVLALDLLPEDVDGRELPFCVQHCDRLARVRERRSRRCTGRRACARTALRDCREQRDDGAVEQGHGARSLTLLHEPLAGCARRAPPPRGRARASRRGARSPARRCAPLGCTCFSAAAVNSTAVFSVSVANCSRCASCTDSACCSANSRRPRRRSSGSPPNGKPPKPPPSMLRGYRSGIR